MKSKLGPVLTVLTLVVGLLNAQGDPDLVVQLPLDEGSGTVAGDVSGQGNDGTLVNGAVFEANTGDGSAFAVRLDGQDDAIDLGVVDVNGAGLTLAARFNADTFPGSKNDPRLISKATGTAANAHVFMLSTIKVGAAVRLRGRVRVGGATTTLIASSGDLPTGAWRHAALTHDGATVRLYVDGVEVGSTPLAGVVDMDPTVTVAVGNQPTGAGVNPFDGLVDDVRILQRALSAEEVAVLVAGNRVPVAMDDGYGTVENTPLVVDTVSGVLANDTDPDLDPLEAVLVDDVSNGTLTLNTDGSFTYTPSPGFSSVDSFTYRASDGALQSNLATVTLTVTGVNDAPVASDDGYQTALDTLLSVPAPGVLANDTDPELDPLQAVLVSDVTNGALTLNADGSFTYTPNLGFSGPDSFTYQASDSLLLSNVATVTLTVIDPSGFMSDDFNACVLNEGPGGWTFYDPLGLSSQQVVGAGTGEAWLEISVPAGTPHDVWNSTYVAPRVMQATADADFEVEVKFLSTVTTAFQMQGVLIEQDPSNWLRFDVHHNGNGVQVFAGSTTGGVSQVQYNQTSASGLPPFMRIRREGDQWTQTVSLDGTTWIPAATFSHALTATQVGVFAGNAGGSPPAHTAQFDYAFNTASPIVPEDGAPAPGPFTLTVNTTGNGVVQRSPDQPSYACGTAVTLTAIPDPGSDFTGWSGDLSGIQNPETVTMGGDLTVGAAFDVAAPPVISNIQVTVTSQSATVTWTTDEPATSAVEYGPTSAYENGIVEDLTLKTAHSLELNGLTADTLYHFQVTSTDSGGLASTSADMTFTTDPTFLDLSGFVSDDFNGCLLNEGAGGWTFYDPQGLSSQQTVGAGTGEAWLEIDVPGGTEHDLWGSDYDAPRVMQAIANADFELEVKFLSPVTAAFQIQGVLIEQDPGNWVRFDAHHNGNGVQIFAASTTGGVSQIEHNETSVSGLPPFMRVRRLGDQWTQTVSFDGIVWTPAASFSHVLAATQAGLFAGTAGNTPPAHTMQVDYAFSTSSPIVPEDGAPAGPYTLTVNTTGNGTVQLNPDQPTYSCGSAVTLTAVPDPGWAFSAWTGAVLSNVNPIVISMTQDQEVTATFEVNTPPVILNLAVAPGDTWATVTWQTDEPATSSVAFGETTAYELGTVSSPAYVTDHSVVIQGLSPETTYHVQATSADTQGLSASSPDVQFVTLQAFALQISNIQVAAQDTSATVSWTTNKPATSAVSYGPTSAYELGTVTDATLQTTHVVVLQPLSPSTEYHYDIQVVAGSEVASSGDRTFTTTSQAPVIDVWYGDNQRFGHLGLPQPFINVLGNVSDPQGVQSLQYSLNNGPLQTLSMGPDNRRLAAPGDFNADIAYVAMNPGVNEVRLVALDTQGFQSEKSVWVDVTHGLVWPTNYTADWSTATLIEDVAQVVDGEWSLEADSVRSIAPDYDRLIAIGDITWQDFEVTTTITAHSLDPGGYAAPSNGPGLGIALRWPGHVDWDGSQPFWGFWPQGAIAWYRWEPSGQENFELLGNRNNQVSKDTSGRVLQLGLTYVYKVRVTTQPDGQHLYQFNTWLDTEAEPVGWQLEILTGNLPDDPVAGSLLLVSHHVDASFGDVVIQPVP